MDFEYDDEQQALRDAVRGLVGKTYADHEHRRTTTKEAPGFDEKLWARMAEMGLLGLPFAEDDGGVGAGPVEIGIVCQELGRVAAPEPYLAAVVMAGGLVAACGTPEQRAEVVTPLAGGELIPALAHAEPGGRWRASASAVTASVDGNSWTLSGTKEPVLSGGRADVLIVSAALPDDAGTGLFVVDPAAATVTDYAVYDGSRAARVDLDGTPATPLGEAGRDLTGSIATVLDLARVMAANQSLGAMRTALSATTDYLKSRKQFGVTLNTFQDLTFRAADMYVSLELTQSLVDWATMVVTTGDAERHVRRRHPGGPPGQPRRSPRRPGDDPAPRRDRDDRRVQRRQPGRPAHRPRPPARRRQPAPRPARGRARRLRDDRSAGLT